METVKINGLYDKAYRAYLNISFNPKKRAESIVTESEQELNNDLQTMPEEEKTRYIENYTSHLFAWLGAMANCYSAMITGGSNFNNARHEKMNNREHKKLKEFLEWRENALKSIAKKIEYNKPTEQKNAEKWERLHKELSQKIKWGSVANLVSMVERLAYNGEIELVNNSLELVRKYNSEHPKPFITDRHKFWTFGDIAKNKAEQMNKLKNSENKEETIKDVRIVHNTDLDRIQLFFPDKPDFDTISKLKRNAFKWSPSNGCWQRQLTQNAIYSTQNIIESL